jgi:hypothetical protein
MGKKQIGARIAGRTNQAVELARGDLVCFATLLHRRFDLAPLHQRIIEQLERVEAGTIDRLMLFLPPRHGKSLISSELFPAWYLGRHPDRSIIASSYGQELASDFGRRVRNHMTRRFGGLGIALIEVEGRVELGLAGEQFLQARLVLERPDLPGPGNRSALSQAARPGAVHHRRPCRGREACARCSAWCRQDCRR